MIKNPGADHPIRVEPNAKRVTVTFAGKTIADTTHAMTMHEADYPPVVYVPRDDVAMGLLERTSHTTHCPYKGDASYFTISAAGRSAENAVWSYEHPYPSALRISSYLAFYPNQVEIVEH
jgi:uncharacterized protein (DUF427 family)